MVLPLLALTWMSAVLAITDRRSALFQILFAVFDSLEGFVIVMVHCILRREVPHMTLLYSGFFVALELPAELHAVVWNSFRFFHKKLDCCWSDLQNKCLFTSTLLKYFFFLLFYLQLTLFWWHIYTFLVTLKIQISNKRFEKM